MTGHKGIELSALLGVYAAPTATSSYTMSLQANGDGVLAGQIVVSTTLFSLFTLFLFPYLGRILHLL